MIPWKQYLTIVVETFRSHYDKMANEERALAQLNLTFAKPCQIEFFSFKDDGQIMFVTLLPNFSDEIIVHENLGKDFNFSSVFDKRLPELNIKEILRRSIKDGKVRPSLSWLSLRGENASFYSFRNLQETYPDPKVYGRTRFKEVYELVESILRGRLRQTKIRSIEEEIKEIKAESKKILDESLRLKMLNHAGKISGSILDVKRLEQHEYKLKSIEQEIGGVRKMIGTTKEYQDFRAFTSDITELKKTHVHKEVFESEIKRLDQRIEDLKAIKFWSKRTLLEMALAIIAAIATLYGAGVIKF